jgi:PAS domain S-box-containing protein
MIFAGIILYSNLLFYIMARYHSGHLYNRILASALLLCDVLFITYFIYIKGGIESRSLLLYALPTLMGALLFGRAGVYTVAIGSAVAYDFVVAGNYFGFLHSPESLTNLAKNGPYVINTVLFFTAILVLVGVLTDFLTRLLILKEKEASMAATALERAQAIARVGSWEWDLQKDELYWSEELYRLFGIKRDGIIRYSDYIILIHPDDREIVEEVVRRAIKNKHDFSFDHRVANPDGKTRMIHGEGKVVQDKQGKIVYMYGTAQDISAERALEDAKGDFVSMASHQLRTPASGVRMLLAMLRDGYAGTLSPEQHQTVEEAYYANERMLRIADDLLNVAKLEAGRLRMNKQQIEMCRWLKNVIAPHKLLAREERQKLQVVLPKGVVYMYGDSERLAMVVDNLLSNARKYTPPKGKITVTLRPGRTIRKIIVTDTGGGMSKAEMTKLFGKFARLDSPGSRGNEGTGLGLYLAKSIVDLHHGTIRVQSRLGKGSTFVVTLPVK